jgi:hypothetical protein
VTGRPRVKITVEVDDQLFGKFTYDDEWDCWRRTGHNEETIAHAPQLDAVRDMVLAERWYEHENERSEEP